MAEFPISPEVVEAAGRAFLDWERLGEAEKEEWFPHLEAAIHAALDKLGLREEQGNRWNAEEIPPYKQLERLVTYWRPVDGWTEEFGPTAVSARVDSEPSEREADLEQAWRNGWGSALNALRACDSISVSAHGATHPEEQRILSDLVTAWVESIESLTDNFVAAGREIGFTSRAHLERSSATSEGETRG
jgi:hypothetical protein